jgi:hypothetical protein
LIGIGILDVAEDDIPSEFWILNSDFVELLSSMLRAVLSENHDRAENIPTLPMLLCIQSGLTSVSEIIKQEEGMERYD